MKYDIKFNSEWSRVYIGIQFELIGRVVSSKFLEIYANVSRDFQKFVNYLCQSAGSKSSIAK